MKTLSLPLRTTLLAALVAAALPLVSPTSASAQDAADAASAAAVVLPGILPAFITAGLTDPAGRVPALNAVAGAAVANLSIATPGTILTHGKHYTYTAALQDNNYTGTYTITYALTQVAGTTTKTLQSGTIVSNKSAGPGSYWVWAVNAPIIPNSPGLATLTATITYGKSVQKVATAVLLN